MSCPNTEARLVDPETGEDTDGDGEIWIRGPQVMRGYLADEEATAATLTEDGWLRPATSPGSTTAARSASSTASRS